MDLSREDCSVTKYYLRSTSVNLTRLSPTLLDPHTLGEQETTCEDVKLEPNSSHFESENVDPLQINSKESENLNSENLEPPEIKCEPEDWTSNENISAENLEPPEIKCEPDLRDVGCSEDQVQDQVTSELILKDEIMYFSDNEIDMQEILEPPEIKCEPEDLTSSENISAENFEPPAIKCEPDLRDVDYSEDQVQDQVTSELILKDEIMYFSDNEIDMQVTNMETVSSTIEVDPREIGFFWKFFDDKIWPRLQDEGYCKLKIIGVPMTHLSEHDIKEIFMTEKDGELQTFSQIEGMNGAYESHVETVSDEAFVKLWASQMKNHTASSEPPKEGCYLYVANKDLSQSQNILNPMLGTFHPNNIFDARQLSTWLTGERPEGIATPIGSYAFPNSRLNLHVEDHCLASINFCIKGSKIWDIAQPKDFDKIVDIIQEAFVKSGNDAEYEEEDKNKCTMSFRHKLYYFDKELLEKNKVKITSVVQNDGEILIVAPKAFHQGYNDGTSVNVAMNFAPPQFLPTGLASGKCECSRSSKEYLLDLRGSCLLENTLLYDIYRNKHSLQYQNVSDIKVREQFVKYVVNNQKQNFPGVGHKRSLTANQIELLPIIHHHIHELQCALNEKICEDLKTNLRVWLARIRCGYNYIKEFNNCAKEMTSKDITLALTGLTPHQVSIMLNDVVATVNGTKYAEAQNNILKQTGLNLLDKKILKVVLFSINTASKNSSNNALELNVLESLQALATPGSILAQKKFTHPTKSNIHCAGRQKVQMKKRIFRYIGNIDTKCLSDVLYSFVNDQVSINCVSKAFLKGICIRKPTRAQVSYVYDKFFRCKK